MPESPVRRWQKRVALASALVFLNLNGISLADPDDSLHPLMKSVGSGRTQKPQIAAVLREVIPDEDAEVCGGDQTGPVVRGLMPGAPYYQ